MTVRKERRRYPRFKKQFDAHCITAESKRGGDECTVINVSLKGMGVIFHTSERIKVGSSVILEIPASGKHEPHSVKGTVKWVKKRDNDYMGGIELSELFDAVGHEGQAWSSDQLLELWIDAEDGRFREASR